MKKLLTELDKIADKIKETCDSALGGRMCFLDG